MFTGLKNQFELTDPFLSNMLSQNHELVKLKKILDWKGFNQIYFECYPSKRGRSTKTTDLTIGLLLLKHYYNLSWEKLVKGVHENIAIMYFCSVSFLQVIELQKAGKLLINPSTMVKTMKRLGAERIRRMERLFQTQLRKAGVINGETLIIDTTSLEKNITYPTEVHLLGRVIECAEKVIQKVKKKAELTKSAVLKRTRQIARVFYSAGKKTKELLERTSQKLLMIAKKQIVKARIVYKKGSRVIREKLKKTNEALTTIGKEIISQIEQKLNGKTPKDRILSFQEPHVRALPKGKIHKPCEFGTKLRIDMSGNGYVTNYENYLGNPNDSTMTKDAVRAHSKKYKKKFKKITADRGFADKEAGVVIETDYNIDVIIPGKQDTKESMSVKERKVYDLRAAVEAKISEGKRCTGLSKCYYHGFEGDKICASLGIFALNARKLIRDLFEHPKIVMSFGM